MLGKQRYKISHIPESGKLNTFLFASMKLGEKKCWLWTYWMKTFRPISSRLFQITRQVNFLITYLLLFILYCDTALTP